jgi:serine/threonine protein kinase
VELREIYDNLVKARRPADFFGIVNEENQGILFRAYAKKVHPDMATDSQKYIAQQAMSLLNKLNAQAVEEYSAGIYGVADTADLYCKSVPLFEFELDSKSHKFYEHFFRGDVGNIYKGTNGEYIIFLKVAADPADNELIRAEFKILDVIKHHSLPVVENQLMINASSAFIMREIEGTPLLQLMVEYPNGVPSEHVMWMLERLFSVVGYLHANKIVHGNIKPEHIIINKKNHNVSLCGFSLCIPEADKPTARYKIVNDIYSPPEISKTARVLPCSDIYAIGKLAILLLGGNIETNGMPITVDERIRGFVRELVAFDYTMRPNDAWGLWDNVIELRTKLRKNEHFEHLK